MNNIYLVAGANGFIGRYISAHLASTGAQVIGVGHGIWPNESWRQWGISNWIEGDITKKVLTEIKPIPFAIINCAGASSVSTSFTNMSVERCKTLESGVEILRYAGEFAPNAKIVMLSSAAVYGESRFLPINENSNLHPISPYGIDKVELEKTCKRESYNNNLSIVILRLFSIYGEELRKQLFWDACIKYVNGDYTFSGNGSEKRDWLHVNDTVRLISAAINEASPACNIFNGGSGKSTTIKDAIDLIAKNMGGRLRANFSGQIREGDPLGYQADIGRAKALGWEPKIDLESGISTYCMWFKRTYK